MHTSGSTVAAPGTPALAAATAPTTRRAAPRLLHVLNGDSVAISLRAAGIQDPVTLAADLLYEGPVTAASSPERWRRTRARFLAECGYDDYDACLARLAGWDRALEGFRAHDEVVLWFEHDLHDQLHLCRLLSWFAGRDRGLTRLSLVQTADYLGRMQPAQLAALLDTRVPVSPAQQRLARAAWDAFCAPSPLGLAELAQGGDTAPMPHLAGALRRHLEEFPGTGDGLARTERQALAALASGPLPFGAVFAASQRMEESVFITDISMLRRLRDLAAGPRPLLRFDPPPGRPGAPARQPGGALLALTAAGHAVLAGQADWLDLCGGIDRWLGGTHLAGRDAAWRWDRAAGRLVVNSAGSPAGAARAAGATGAAGTTGGSSPTGGAR